MQLGKVGAQPSPFAWLRPGPCIRGGLAPASFGCKWGSYETGTWTSRPIGRHEGDREIGTRTEGTRTEGEPPPWASAGLPRTHLVGMSICSSI